MKFDAYQSITERQPTSSIAYSQMRSRKQKTLQKQHKSTSAKDGANRRNL